MFVRSLIPFIFLTAGCADTAGIDNLTQTTGEASTPGSEPSATATTGPTTQPATEPSTAVDGAWVVTDRMLTLDECGMTEWLSEQELGTVEITGDWIDGFELVHSRGIEACSENVDVDDAFRCDRRQEDDTRVQDDYGIDALLLLDIWATGSMVIGDTLTMTTEIITDCEGSGCWLAALETGGFPCHSTVVVTAEPL